MLKYKIKKSGRNILSLLEYGTEQESKYNGGEYHEEGQNSDKKKKARKKVRSRSEARVKEKTRLQRTETETQTEVLGEYNYLVRITNISLVLFITSLSGSHCDSLPGVHQVISSGGLQVDSDWC